MSRDQRVNGRETQQAKADCDGPVVPGRPVAGELLDRHQLHALRPVSDELRGGPAHPAPGFCRRFGDVFVLAAGGSETVAGTRGSKRAVLAAEE